MEQQTPSNSLMREAMKNALLWALINIVIFLAVYYIVPQLMSSFAFSIIQLLIGAVLAALFTIDLKKKVGGFWSFKVALKHIFVMFILQAFIVYAFTIVFSKYLDPNYAQTMKTLILDNTEETLKKFITEPDQLKEAMKKTEENLEAQFNPSFSQMLIGFGTVMIIYFIGALVFAAIFKKDRPVFINTETNTIVEG